jgi:hypothetical protein
MVYRFDTERRGDLLVVTEPAEKFIAIYIKPSSNPQLKLMRRSATEDHALIAKAWQTANDKARELGWIV